MYCFACLHACSAAFSRSLSAICQRFPQAAATKKKAPAKKAESSDEESSDDDSSEEEEEEKPAAKTAAAKVRMARRHLAACRAASYERSAKHLHGAHVSHAAHDNVTLPC